MVRIGSLCLVIALTTLATPLAAQSTAPSLDRETFASAAGDPSDQAPKAHAVGRLVLPWGRHDSSRVLSLALKNDSRNHPRAFRVVFFLPNGEPAAATEELGLPPRGSLAFSVDDLIEPGQWEVGSIEILFRGPGGGRLIGTARQADLALAQSEVQPLVQAQFRVIRAVPEPPTDPPSGVR